MTLGKLAQEVQRALQAGYDPNMLVVYRDDETDPDLDIEAAYPDEEADRYVIRGY